MKNILVIVDMQQGFLFHEQTAYLRQKVLQLLNLNIFDVVIATRFLNDDYSIYENLMGWSELKTLDMTSIDSELLNHIDIVFDKYIYNGINTNFLQKICQCNDGKMPEKLFLVGVDTDCCVLATATSLFEHNIRPVVLTNYCASNGGIQSHEAGLLCLTRLIGKSQLRDDELNHQTDLSLL